MSRRHAPLRWIALAVATVIALGVRPAAAEDQVDELTRVLAAGATDKTRLAAVAALARLGDRRAMKPLVAALADPSPEVRALAAASLGKLGHKAALPALKGCAVDDTSPEVRASAHDAAIAVAKANGLPPPWPAAAKRARGKPGFGNQPRALEGQPDVYLLVNSANDDSPGKADKKMRATHASIVKQTLVERCRAAPEITTAAADAQRLGLDPRHVDVSVTKLEAAAQGTMIEVEAQLRLAISDDKGKMLSFLSGGAKIQVPRSKFDPRYLPNMRREVLESAMRGMFDKLLAHLRDRSQT